MSGSEPTGQPGSSGSVTEQSVRTALDSVLDPELDRSIVELEYIEEITIERAPSGSETNVRMAFLLPTAWCSPAFAWMMATDAKSAIESISGVDSAEIVLRDHMHETEINTGVNEGRPFGEAFPDADGGLEAVRATLDHKARLARQYDAVEALLDAGLSPAQIVALTPADLDRDTDDDRIHIYLGDRSFGVSVDADPIEEYLEMATAEGCLTGETDPLFRMPDGDPIDESMFELLRRRTRSAKVNVNSQGTVCDALNESRREMIEGTGSR
ncbi:iron-sulfur cluster assembly protein [Halohasta litorea]|uniref:Iron-sulfur cluster assembly protein n=1 Tax=Halohasta litorea TaxID=869891 RepID=A0ABD6D923_9EURY|nr:iron-sulfur cluster assembly protein [Halohasta litorea]